MYREEFKTQMFKSYAKMMPSNSILAERRGCGMSGDAKNQKDEKQNDIRPHPPVATWTSQVVTVYKKEKERVHLTPVT